MNSFSICIIFILISSLFYSPGELKAETTSQEEYFKKAHEFLDKNEYDRAVTQIMKILDVSKDSIEARLMLARLKFKQQNHEEAYDQVRYIVKLDSENIEAKELGNQIFLDSIRNEDFDSYRNFLFYSCNFIFSAPRPDIEEHIIFLLKNYPDEILNNNKQINPKGNITIYVLSTVYASFANTVPVLTKYFSNKNLEGEYTARTAIKNIQEEEENRKNPNIFKKMKTDEENRKNEKE